MGSGLGPRLPSFGLIWIIVGKTTGTCAKTPVIQMTYRRYITLIRSYISCAAMWRPGLWCNFGCTLSSYSDRPSGGHVSVMLALTAAIDGVERQII